MNIFFELSHYLSFLFQKYIDLAVSLEGLSSDVPIYVVIEGYEPCFFTTYFSWNSAKAIVSSNGSEHYYVCSYEILLHMQ